MKLSESWLREWVNPPLTREQLSAQLTMAGLEIEELQPVAEKFSGVLVGEVCNLQAHPQAEKLQVCTVNIGRAEPLSIVCGATNVKAQMKVAVAIESAVLLQQKSITSNEIRGVVSQGMLCSAAELGLSDNDEGLFELPSDAPLGVDVWEYLQLDDYLFDVSITPNRGDCLSILGVAKEVAALTQTPLIAPDIVPIPAKIKDELKIHLADNIACPHYVGRVIRQINPHAVTPMWLCERLRRGGIRTINPVVDVVNFVMLELGQPMHAFSLAKICGSITVRQAKANEQITLLDESEVTLDAGTLIIADDNKPLAIAGVMGGLDSAVTTDTTAIFLESAYFTPAIIASAGRRYKLSSDSAYRFERGVDPLMQIMAIERVTALLLEIVGGEVGPITEVINKDAMPQAAVIPLRLMRIKKLLGYEVPPAIIEGLLARLEFSLQQENFGWTVTVPARRSDVTIEADLIEEIARLSGYEHIPVTDPKASLTISPLPETKLSLTILRQTLMDLGYHEVITYSFVDQDLQNMFTMGIPPIELVNPMTADMSVMRNSLFPGLINTLIYNQNRQQKRIRIFESGLRFILHDDQLIQQRMLAGLISGNISPEQWSVQNKEIDFFDLKADLESLFNLTITPDQFSFKPAVRSGLHPGQTAEIYRGDKSIGIMGALHPNCAQNLKIEGKTFVFELDLDQIEIRSVPKLAPISKFPEIRRDIALLLEHSVPAQAVQDTIREVAGEWLKAVDIFDVYQGKRIEPGRKSLALALLLQHSQRTLVDEEVADLMERVIVALKRRFNAELRG